MSELVQPSQLWTPRVCVTQNLGFDHSDAEKNFGMLQYLLSPREADVRQIARVTALLKKRLWDMRFSDRDYLLAIGSPAVIMLTGYLAMQVVKKELQVLQWDREQRHYRVVKLRK